MPSWRARWRRSDLAPRVFVVLGPFEAMAATLLAFAGHTTIAASLFVHAVSVFALGVFIVLYGTSYKPDSDDDDWRRGGEEPPPEDPDPTGDGARWDDFERDFRQYVAEREPSRP